MHVYERFKKSSLRCLHHTHFYSKVAWMGKRQKETKCPKTDDCINKTRNISTIECHLTLGKKIICVIRCIKLESIKWSEINQSPRDKYCMILQICRLNSQVWNRMLFFLCVGRRMEKELLQGYEVSVLQDGKICGLRAAMATQLRGCLWHCWTVYLTVDAVVILAMLILLQLSTF